MTPDACPFCGAPRPTSSDYVPWYAKSWRCGTVALRASEVMSWSLTQSPECARYVRTRISQLRRMAHTAWLRAGHPLNADSRWYRKRSQYNRFAAACLREIDRLKEAAPVGGGAKGVA